MTNSLKLPADTDAKTYFRRLDYYLGLGETPEDAEQWALDDAQCNGHESLSGAHFGEAVFCRGTH
jgi:hypothetical protein